MKYEFDHVVGQFQRQSLSNPEAVCLISAGSEITYKQIETRAQAIAHKLIAKSIVRGKIVACLVDENPLDLIATSLAVLSVGAAYAHVAPTMPEARRTRMLAKIKPDVLLVSDEAFLVPSADTAPTILLSDVDISDASWPDAWEKVEPEDAFNIVFTSGSTGDPRAVQIPHRAVDNRLAWMWSAYPFADHDVVAWHKSPTLVAAPWEMFGGLLAGVPTRFISGEEIRDSYETWETIKKSGVTFFHAAPALIEGLVWEMEREGSNKNSSALRVVTSSAAPIGVGLVRRFRTLSPNTTLLNMYGLSECASNVATFDTARLSEAATSVPIGRPIDETSIVLVDGRLRPVPIGVEGEMLISGATLAIGYLDDPEYSAQRFLSVDLGEGQVRRVYRTGDRARMLSDGTLEYKGRTDDQVQIRGFRVELEEVRAAIESQPSVLQAAIRAVDIQGETALVAYVAGDSADVSEIRSFLANQLPEYMLPARFVFVPNLPMTRSGKVDVAALDDLGFDSGSPSAEIGFVDPRSNPERVIAAIWCDVLGLERVSVFDVFFDIGGHSLIAIRVIARMRKVFNVEIPVRTIFDNNTVARLAEAVELLVLAEIEASDK